MNLNFVKEVQFVVEHVILAVFAAVVETTELNREDRNVQQLAIPQTKCIAGILLTLCHAE